jgi:subtilisin family serine protease
VEYQICIGGGLATFNVREDLIAVKEGDDVRGSVDEAALQDLVLPSVALGENRELLAFAKAGWRIGAPKHGWVREQADRAARIDSLDVRQVLVDDAGRYYLDSGRVVARVTAPDLDAAIDRLEEDGLSVLRQLPLGSGRSSGVDHILLARISHGGSTLETVQGLQDSGRYKYMEPDLVEYIEGRLKPPAPHYHLQWQWANDGSGGGILGADVGAEQAWNQTRGADACIAVVDHGFQLDHPAFHGAVGWGGYFTKTQDGGQFIALPSGAPRGFYPAYEHGTACAGMAVARCGGGGGCGIAHEATFMPMACLGDQTLTQTTLAEALVYAALPARSGQGANARGADVISCSLGPNHTHWRLNSVLSDAIEAVTTEGRNGLGTLLVWAASNANVPIDNDKVVSDRRVLAVGRSTRMDRHDNTAFGEGLDLVAPGVDVYTTLNGATWGFMTGCSFAAPIVAGVAGLLIAQRPSFTRNELAERLLSTCKKIGGGYDSRGRSPRYGFGRLNAAAAVL